MRTPHVPIPAPPPHSTPPISPHFTLPTHYPHPLPPTHPLRLAPGPPTASPPTTAAAPPAPTCRLETNKLRNTAKLFAHLLATDSIPWAVLQVRGWACRRECAARPVFHPAMPWLCTAQHSMRRVVTSQAPLQGRRRRMGGRAVLPCGPLVHVACLPPPPPRTSNAWWLGWLRPLAAAPLQSSVFSPWPTPAQPTSCPICPQVMRLTEEDTTSSSRIFIKILFQELAETLGLVSLNRRLNDPTCLVSSRWRQPCLTAGAAPAALHASPGRHAGQQVLERPLHAGRLLAGGYLPVASAPDGCLSVRRPGKARLSCLPGRRARVCPLCRPPPVCLRCL